MTARFVAAGLAAALLAGCGTLRDLSVGRSSDAAPGAELAGRTLRMQAANGEVTTLRFRESGTVRATFRGRTLDGRWEASSRRLCFFWPNVRRECWPYREPLVRGRTRTITSDRGNVVRVTML